MKLTKEQKQALCNLIENSLNSARLIYWKDENGDGAQLLDIISTGDTIETGEEEIRNLVEQIYFDVDKLEL